MKNILLRLSLFFSICLVILIAYGFLCEWFFKQEKFLPSDSRRYWAMKQKNQEFDYVVLGSSRAEGAFDMAMLDSLTGLKGINIGSNGSGFVDNYLVLTRFIENKNKFKYLFLQTDIYSLDPTRSFSNAFHVYNFIPYWKSPVFKDAISHYLDNTDQKMFSLAPWMRFYKYNKYYSPLQMVSRFRSAKKKNKRLDQQIKSTAAFPKNYMIDSTLFFKSKGSKKITVDSFDLKYLVKIFEFAKANGVRVICFTAPDYHYQSEVYSNYQETSAFLVSFLKQKGIQYLPANDSIKKDIEHFKDPGHLNDYGRYLHTNSFSKRISEAIKASATN